jgi:anti-sigma factor RsiW
MERHWTDRLSEYLDGELGEAEHAEAERHLVGCAECSGVLADLEAVARSAGLLPDEAPAHDLWPGIRDRLEPRAVPARSRDVIPLSPRGRLLVSIPQLIAAGLALMVVSGAAVWIALGGAGAGPASTGAPMALEAQGPDHVVLAAYQPVLAELEAEYEQRRNELDPETIQVVERNLAIIDEAVREARDALAADPGSTFLYGRLAEAMRWRVTVLREAASI